MFFPNQEIKRKQFHLLNQMNGLLSGLDIEYVVGRSDLELLVESPSYNDFKKITSDAVKKGVIAGDLITCIYLMQLFEIPEPSFNKAIFIMKEFALTHNVQYGDGTGLPRSEQTIRDYWKEFAPAAHLWGAYRINQSYQFSDTNNVLENGDFNTFLQVAAGFLKFGKEFAPFRAKARLPLLGNNVWALPETIIPRELVNGKFPDQMSKFLESYKAPITN